MRRFVETNEIFAKRFATNLNKYFNYYINEKITNCQINEKITENKIANINY